MDGKPWRIELLGESRARYREGEWRPLPTQKPVALLLYLAAFPQRPQPREALVELLWPGGDPEAGRHSLRAALYALRRLLESAGGSVEDLLLADRTTLRLHPAAFSTDLEEYRAAVAAATGAQTPGERAQALAQAAAGYRGEFLPGFTEAWAFEERERLSTTQRELLQRLVGAREELGEGEGALTAARELVRLDPLWEEAHYEVMRLYAALGQPSACLRQYQELERLLREELGETPSAAPRALAAELRESARTVVAARTSRPLARLVSHRPAAPPGDPAVHALPEHLSAANGGPAAPPRGFALPVQLTRFFGREEEIARVASSLWSSEMRLVTLTGPGGSGKTRLALAVAARLQDRFAGRVAFAPLADLTDPHGIPDAIADALALPRSPQVEPWEQVVAAIQGGRWLLVLDNFEHLVAEGALLVRQLLGRAPLLTCLVTSRQRLNLGGEQEFAVLPLPTPRKSEAPERLLAYPSVQLFVDRARAVRAEFQVTAGNAAAVAGLCDRLEGLPLALELAAARAAVLSPAQMLAQMEQRFQLLVTRQRDVPARHRTLLAAIEGSYQGLGPELQRFFTRLSVFRGGWTLAAAAAVCAEGAPADAAEGVGRVPTDAAEGSGRVPTDAAEGSGHSEAARKGAEAAWKGAEAARAGQALDYLTELCECSLVVAEMRGREAASGGEASETEEVRYRLLETLREYAWEQLRAADELSATRDRHRDWHLQLAEQAEAALDGPEEAAVLRRLATEFDNLGAALTWCLEAAERDPAGDGAALGLRLASALGWFWRRRGYLKECLQWLEEALARGSQLPAALRAPALWHAAFLAQHSGERERGTALYQAARQEYEEVVRLAREAGNPLDLVRALVALAEPAGRCGDLDAAWRYCVEARRLLETMTAPIEVARLLSVMAMVLLRREGWPAARSLLEEHVAICRQLGNPHRLIHALGAMGHVERDDGNHGRAEALYRESLLLRRELGDQLAVAMCFEDLATLASRQGQHDHAARLLGAGEALCETLGARPPVASATDHERTVAGGRAALGETAFAAVWAEGRALSLQQAVDHALGGT